MLQGLSIETQTAAGVLGLLAVPVVAWSEYTLKQTGTPVPDPVYFFPTEAESGYYPNS